MELLPSQRKSIHEELTRYGFNPQDFRWHDEVHRSSGVRRLRLSHNASAYYFEFIPDSNGHAARLSPGDHKVTESWRAADWPLLLGIFRHWLGYLKRELAIVDPWSMIESPNPTPAQVEASDENSPFTDEEVHVVHEQLDSLLLEVERLAIGNTEERQALARSLADLKESASRLSRKDWKAAFLGTLMGLVLSHVVSQKTMSATWATAQNVFHGAVRLLGGG